MEDKEYISKGFLTFYFMQDSLAAKKNQPRRLHIGTVSCKKKKNMK